MGKHSFNREKIWNLLKVGVALFLLGFVLSTTDLGQIISLRYKLSWIWLVSAFLLLAGMTALKAWQYHFLIGMKLRYSRVLGITILQNVITNFVASTAGIASQVTLMTAGTDVKLGRAAISFAIAKMGDLFAVSIILLLSSLYVWPQAESVHGIVVALLILTLILALLIVLSLFLRSHVVTLVKKGLSFFKVARFSLVQRGITTLEYLASQDHGKIIRVLLYGTGYSMIYMLLTVIWAYTRFRTFSLVMDISVIAFVVSLLQYVSWIPITVFGGLGVTETLSVYLYGIFGVNKPELAAILLGSRVIFYLMNAVSLLYLPLETLLYRDRGDAQIR